MAPAERRILPRVSDNIQVVIPVRRATRVTPRHVSPAPARGPPPPPPPACAPFGSIPTTPSQMPLQQYATPSPPSSPTAPPRKVHKIFRLTAPSGRVTYNVLYTDGTLATATHHTILDHVSRTDLEQYEHKLAEKERNMETVYHKRDDMGAWAGGTEARVKKEVERELGRLRKGLGRMELDEQEEEDDGEAEQEEAERRRSVVITPKRRRGRLAAVAVEEEEEDEEEAEEEQEEDAQTAEREPTPVVIAPDPSPKPRKSILSAPRSPRRPRRSPSPALSKPRAPPRSPAPSRKSRASPAAVPPAPPNPVRHPSLRELWSHPAPSDPAAQLLRESQMVADDKPTAAAPKRTPSALGDILSKRYKRAPAAREDPPDSDDELFAAPNMASVVPSPLKLPARRPQGSASSAKRQSRSVTPGSAGARKRRRRKEAPPPPPPEEGEGEGEQEEEEEYEVEAIRAVRTGARGEEEYFVKWKGYAESENTWEPLGNLLGSLEIVREFREKRGLAPVFGDS